MILFLTKNSFKLKKPSIKALLNSNKNMSMKVSGIIIKEMEEELNNGRVDQSTKDIGKIILLMVMADLFMLMEMYI